MESAEVSPITHTYRIQIYDSQKQTTLGLTFLTEGCCDCTQRFSPLKRWVPEGLHPCGSNLASRLLHGFPHAVHQAATGASDA